jgi:hypothetical protein
MTTATDTTKFFSIAPPREHLRPGARKLVVGDEWHNDSVVKVWNGTAWVLKVEPEKEAAKETPEGAKKAAAPAQKPAPKK